MNKKNYSYHKTTPDGVDYSAKYEDGDPIPTSGGAGLNQKTLSSKSEYSNNLRDTYAKKFGAQPVEVGHSNPYDDGKKKVYYQKNSKVEKTLGVPHAGRKPKK